MHAHTFTFSLHLGRVREVTFENIYMHIHIHTFINRFLYILQVVCKDRQLMVWALPDNTRGKSKAPKLGRDKKAHAHTHKVNE